MPVSTAACAASQLQLCRAVTYGNPCSPAHQFQCHSRAALPLDAAADADAIVSTLCELLGGHGPGIVRNPSLEDVAAGVAHCLCAAQVNDSTVSIALLRKCRPEFECVTLKTIHTAGHVPCGIGSLIRLLMPCRMDAVLQVSNAGAQWLLASLLAAWSAVGPPGSIPVPQLDQQALMWRAMQLVGHTVPQQASPQTQTAAAAAQSAADCAAAADRLHCLAAVLCSAISDGQPVQATAALLAAAGFMQGLRAAGRGDATLSVLVHITAWLPPACVAAAAAEDVARDGPAQQAHAASLLREAASLAALVASQVALQSHIHNAAVLWGHCIRLHTIK